MCDSRISARPSLPFGEQLSEGVVAAVEPVAAKELGGGRRGTGAGIEKGDANLAPRERLVQHGHIADDQRYQSQADTGFDDQQRPRRKGLWHHVSQS